MYCNLSFLSSISAGQQPSSQAEALHDRDLLGFEALAVVSFAVEDFSLGVWVTSELDPALDAETRDFLRFVRRFRISSALAFDFAVPLTGGGGEDCLICSRFWADLPRDLADKERGLGFRLEVAAGTPSEVTDAGRV